MKHIIAFAVLCLGIGCQIQANVPVNVVDKTDRSPIIGATVIDRAGIIVGITDGNGQISVKSEANFPITVRYIGYEPLTTSERDTIAMTATSYALKEVEINPADRPIKRVICFAREYSSGIAGKDTMQLYSEYMAQAFIAEGKVKGYKKYDAHPHIRNTKRYARIVKTGNDSIFKPRLYDDVTELSWYDLMAFLPTEKLELRDAIKEGAETDTVFGKYGPQFIYSLKNNIYSQKADILSNQKNRKVSPWLFKLFGLTVDIDAGVWTMSYNDKGKGTFGIYDLISGTYNIHIIGRGKWIRKILDSKYPIEMNSYLEIYPLEITNCTVEEYKELNTYDRIPFQYPAGLQPLSPAIQSLVDSLES